MKGLRAFQRIKVAKPADKDELFVVLKKGRLFVYYRDYAEKDIELKNLEDVIDSLKPSVSLQPVTLSDRFWDEYEGIKNFRETGIRRLTEQSIEQRAINNLKTLLNMQGIDELIPHKDFIRMLLEDILEYGTLSDYTLRRIANINSNRSILTPDALKEILRLKKELGENYLYKEKERLKEIAKEIIIGVENRKIF